MSPDMEELQQVLSQLAGEIRVASERATRAKRHHEVIIATLALMPVNIDVKLACEQAKLAADTLYPPPETTP